MRVNVLCGVRLRSFEVAQQLKKRGILCRLYSGAVLFGRRGNPRDYGLDPADLRFFRLPQVVNYLSRRLLPRRTRLAVRQGCFQTFSQWAARVMGRADVVHAWSEMALAPFRRARAHGAACVLDRSAAHNQYWVDVLTEEYARWGGIYDYSRATLDDALREYDEADAVVVPSRFCRETLVDHGVEPDKVHVIPFGMQTVGLGPPRSPQTVFRVLYVGSLRILKGIPYLLQAAEMLKDLPDFELVLVGGPPRPAVAKLMSMHPGCFRYLGFRPKRALFNQVYPSGSVLVQPSLMEGMSYVVIEALSHGLPVITTRNTGAEDIITDGREGFFIPIRDPRAIADRVRLLYEDRERLEEMSAEALALSRKTGRTWDDYGADIEALYRRLLNREGLPSAPTADSLAKCMGGASKW